MAEWKSIADAAILLEVSERRVRDLVDSGALAATRVGARSWLVDADAVRRRKSHPPVPGRPLSAPLAWLALACIQHALDGKDSPDPVEHAERQLRFRVGQLLAEPASAARWERWLSRRAERRRVWIHPGVLAAFLADERVHPGGAAAAASLGLSHSGGAHHRVYVGAEASRSLAADYQLVDDADGNVELMVMPAAAADLVSRPGPVPAAVALADLVESQDSREHSLAARQLESMSWPAS